MSKFTVKIVYNYKPVIYGSIKFYGIGPRSQTCSLLTTTRSSQAQGKVFNLLFPKKPEVERNQLQYFVDTERTASSRNDNVSIICQRQSSWLKIAKRMASLALMRQQVDQEMSDFVALFSIFRREMWANVHEQIVFFCEICLFDHTWVITNIVWHQNIIINCRRFYLSLF